MIKILKYFLDKKDDLENQSELIYSEFTKGKIDDWNRKHLRFRIYKDFIIIRCYDAFLRIQKIKINMNEIESVERNINKGFKINHINKFQPEDIIIWSRKSMSIFEELNKTVANKS